MQTLTIRESRQDLVDRLSILNTKLKLTNNPRILVSIDTDDAFNEVEELLIRKRILESKLKLN